MACIADLFSEIQGLFEQLQKLEEPNEGKSKIFEELADKFEDIHLEIENWTPIPDVESRVDDLERYDWEYRIEELEGHQTDDHEERICNAESALEEHEDHEEKISRLDNDIDTLNACVAENAENLAKLSEVVAETLEALKGLHSAVSA